MGESPARIVSLADLRGIVAGLPGTVEDVKWGADLCFCVGGKMYCVYGLGGGGFSFKSDAEGFARLTRRPGFRPAAYVARYHWVSVAPDAELEPAEVAALVGDSYARVVAGLPRRLRPSPAG